MKEKVAKYPEIYVNEEGKLVLLHYFSYKIEGIAEVFDNITAWILTPFNNESI